MIDFPDSQHDVIYADPAWRFLTRSDKGRGRSPDAPVTRAAGRRNQPERHYPTMTLDEIKALPVADLANKDCVLLMWVVDPMLPHALEVGKAWGFTYKTVGFYWAKLRKAPMKPGRDTHLDEERKMFPMGTGYWTRANPEQCFLFTRGRPERKSAGVAKLIAMEDEPGSRLIVSPRREHSRKPDEAYDRIDQLCGADKSKIELFARQSREGWTSWGNDTRKFDAPKAPRSKADLLG